MNIDEYTKQTLELLHQEFDVVIDLDEVPWNVGMISHNHMKKWLTIRDLKSVAEWVPSFFKTGNESVVVTGPMSNVVALQISISIVECTTGAIAYYVKGDTKTYDLVRGCKAEVEA